MASGLLDEGAGPYDSQAFRAAARRPRDPAAARCRPRSAPGRAADAHRPSRARLRTGPPGADRARASTPSRSSGSAARSWPTCAGASPTPTISPRAAGSPRLSRTIPTAARTAARPRASPRSRPTTAAPSSPATSPATGSRSASPATSPPEELAPLLDSTFGELPAGSALGEIAGGRTPVVGKVEVLRLTIPQSVVVFGHGGLERNDPGLLRRLRRQLHPRRRRLQLAPARGGAREARARLLGLFLPARARRAPLWLGGVATNNEQVAQSLAIVRGELARMAAGELDETDLADARPTSPARSRCA